MTRLSAVAIIFQFSLLYLVSSASALCEDVAVGNKHYDLSSIAGRDFRAQYSINRFTYTLQFRVCGNIADTCPLYGLGSPRCAMPNTGAVCQRQGSKNYCLGVYNGTVDAYEYNGNFGTGVYLQYLNGDLCESCSPVPNRHTVVVIICDEGALGEPSDFLVEPYTPPNSRTTVSFRHKSGCVKYIGSNSGLSAGSVMLIVIFVFVIVYFVGGILFLKFYRKQEGRDIVPNVDFWSSIPGLVKDGATFLGNKIRGRDSGSYQQLPQEY